MSALREQRRGQPLSLLLKDMVAVDAAVERDAFGVALDSRSVTPGTLFLACAGTRRHGRDFIDAAVRAGAAAVGVETEHPAAVAFVEAHGSRVPVISIPDLAHRAGEIAARFYGHPSEHLRVIGVTGTNGKTSVSSFLAQVLNGQGGCGLIGTLGSGVYGRLRDLGHTTPDAVTLQAELAAIRDSGARFAAIEVSSHGIDQGRVSGVRFDTAVFTNISRDHLDYHGDMAAYAEAKRRLLDSPGLKRAVLNLDDAYGRRWLETLSPEIDALGYGLASDPAPTGRQSVAGRLVRLDPAGLALEAQTPWGTMALESSLLGRFNAGNILAVTAVLGSLGMSAAAIAAGVGHLQTPPGRMERFGGGAGKPLVVVDYAHTPDALKEVLRALREHCRGRLWCVFGCGGDRDAGKRPLMGAVAEDLADFVVVTDDNPRDEDPWGIVGDILAGMGDPDGAYVVRDRTDAIAHAVEVAVDGDIVLVAGKGHETCQWAAGRCRPFSDVEEVHRALEARNG